MASGIASFGIFSVFYRHAYDASLHHNGGEMRFPFGRLRWNEGEGDEPAFTGESRSQPWIVAFHGTERMQTSGGDGSVKKVLICPIVRDILSHVELGHFSGHFLGHF